MPAFPPPNLVRYLKDESPERIFITSHVNSDPDGFCSAAALAQHLKRVLPFAEIRLVFDSLTRLSGKIADLLSISFSNRSHAHPDVWIVTDTSNPSQLGDLHEQVLGHEQVIFIDHHTVLERDLTLHEYSYIDNVPSTGELVFSLLEQSPTPISDVEATLLLMAIIYDTRRFLLARPSTFNVAAVLVNAGADYSMAVDVLKNEMDVSERIARLKGAQRAKIIRHKGWTIAYSHVSAYEASVARALIDLGADVAFCVAERQNEVRISARSSQFFYQATGIELDKDILSHITDIIDG
ncbi:MAG: DHH family phosphoesterase, partial [Candidatus Ranarchaeia archaeon]